MKVGGCHSFAKIYLWFLRSLLGISDSNFLNFSKKMNCELVQTFTSITSSNISFESCFNLNNLYEIIHRNRLHFIVHWGTLTSSLQYQWCGIMTTPLFIYFLQLAVIFIAFILRCLSWNNNRFLNMHFNSNTLFLIVINNDTCTSTSNFST